MDVQQFFYGIPRTEFWHAASADFFIPYSKKPNFRVIEDKNSFQDFIVAEAVMNLYFPGFARKKSSSFQDFPGFQDIPGFSRRLA